MKILSKIKIQRMSVKMMYSLVHPTKKGCKFERQNFNGWFLLRMKQILEIILLVLRAYGIPKTEKKSQCF